MTKDIRILVVEDDGDYLQRILNRLEHYSYAAPDTARNEHKAQQCLEQAYYDVIVTDMRLEGNSGGGFAVVEEVERLSITSVVIVLTANDTVADCRKALRGGGRCWDYISKSMVENSALEVLHHSIQEAIDWHSGRGKQSRFKINSLMNNVIGDASTETELKLLKNAVAFAAYSVELPRDVSIAADQFIAVMNNEVDWRRLYGNRTPGNS